MGFPLIQGFTVIQGGQEVTALGEPPSFSHHWGASARRQISNGSLAVIHLRCWDMPSSGSPPHVLVALLHSYFPVEGMLQFHEVTFDLGSPSKVQSHLLAMGALASKLRCCLPSRILIFVSTHSDKDRGDLLAGRNAKGVKFASEISNVSFILFPAVSH